MLCAVHAAFLQTRESSALLPAPGNEELLQCDCQKVMCNCLKRCDAFRNASHRFRQLHITFWQSHCSNSSLPGAGSSALLSLVCRKAACTAQSIYQSLLGLSLLLLLLVVLVNKSWSWSRPPPRSSARRRTLPRR